MILDSCASIYLIMARMKSDFFLQHHVLKRVGLVFPGFLQIPWDHNDLGFIKMSINLLNVLVCSSYKDVGVLVTSHAPITANENLANKPYFCLGLLAKHADLQRPVDAIPIILGIFNTFSPS